jgi:hypothetical protein
LVGSLEGNRPLERLVRKLEGNIKIDHEIEWEGQCWIRLVPNRVRWWTVVNMASGASGHIGILWDGELRKLYMSQSSVRVVKCRALRWTGRTARMRRPKTSTDFFFWGGVIHVGKRSLEVQERRREENIRIGYVDCGDKRWMELV